MCRRSVSKFTLTTNGLVTVTKSTEENIFLKLEKMVFQLGQIKNNNLITSPQTTQTTAGYFLAQMGTSVQDRGVLFVVFNNTARFPLKNVPPANVLDGSCPSHSNLTGHVQLVHP